MADIPVETFLNFFLYLLVPFGFGYAAKKLKISPIIGYIIGGIVLGNFLDGLVHKEIINSFALFGIILLLFTVGLEVNLNKLVVLKRFIVLGGLLQLSLTLFAVTVISSFFGFTFLQSFLIGIALVSSSTTIVAKMIQDKGEEGSFLGEIALGILMFQDLAFIPFIIIFTFFNSQEVALFDIVRNIAFAMLEAGLILWIMYYVGKRLIPRIFNSIARTSRELLNLFIIVFIFLVAALSSSFGVPILVGAFIAGVLVSQTAEHYHIFSQIRPLRDLMAIIFFVYIGTHVKVAEVVFLIPSIIAFGVLITIVKALILLGIFLYFRFSSRMAFYLAVFLFQVSENAFILLSLAFNNKLFDPQQYLFIISSVLFSLMLTPVLINNKDFLYDFVRGFLKKYIPAVELFVKHRIDFDTSPLDVFNARNHVVICGYGRVGSQVGKALALANIPFIAVDYNYHVVERAKQDGTAIIYGDPTDYDVLDFAETEHASALLAAVPSNAAQESIIMNARKLNNKLIIIGRAHSEADHQRMKDLGANVVIRPELEASLSIIKKLFLLKRMPKEEIVKLVRHIKLVHGAI